MTSENRPQTDRLDDALVWRSKFWKRPLVDVGRLDRTWTSLETITGSDAALEDWLSYEGSFTPSLDRRGQAAYLIADYCNLLCPAVVPLFLGRNLVPDLHTSSIAVSYSSHSTTLSGRIMEERDYRLRFLTDGKVPAWVEMEARPASELRDRFREGMEETLEGLINGLNRLTRLSRNALWRLAGDAIGAAFLDAGQRLNAQSEALDHATAILKSPGSPLNNKQLHFFEIAIPDPHDASKDLLRRTFRGRGGCCRYYTADGGSLCTTCVLKDREARDRDIFAAMQRFLRTGKIHHAHDH